MLACEGIPEAFLSNIDAESFAPIQTWMREKSSEFASEKVSMAVRVNSTAQLVSKQI